MEISNMSESFLSFLVSQLLYNYKYTITVNQFAELISSVSTV